jgi:autotransporter-associated beta strand protein
MKSFLPCLISAVTLVLHAPAQSLVTGLVAYYDFEESGTAGLANKAPGASGFNATRHGGGTFDSSANPSGPGFSGNAAFNPGNGDSNRSVLLAGNSLNLVDSRTDAIVVPVANTNLGASFTISVWHALTPSGGSVARPFVFEQANNNFNISWGIGSGDSYTAYVTTASSLGGVVLGRDVWHHVAHVFDSDGTTTTMRLYVNGELVGTRTGATANLTFSGINFGRARNNANGRDWDGMMDEIALWNRALDETEILRVHSLGLQGQALTGATERFWDTDGETAGAGGSTPSGLWAGANWTSDSSGATATGDWAPGATAVLAAGADATGPYSITLAGTETADAVIARTGSPTLTGGTLVLDGLNLLSALNGTTLTVQSALQTPQLITSGAVTLTQSAVVAGPLEVLSGPLSLPAGSTFGGLVGTGMVEIGGTLALTPETDSPAAFSGPLDGSGTLRVDGPGRQSITRSLDDFDGTIAVTGGTLLLSGPMDHSGGVAVSGGLLVTASDLPGPVTVGPAGTLAAGTTPDATTPTQINLGDAGDTTNINGTLHFSLNGGNAVAGGGVNDLLRVPGNITFGAGSVVSPTFSGVLLAGNSYTLLEVNGTRTGTPVIDPGVQARYRYTLTLSGGTAFPDDLMLEAAGAPAVLKWVGDGTANSWQIGGPTHWLNGLTPSAFLIPDEVTFDDSGDNSVPIQLAENVAPSGVLVNATKNYTFTGPGVITGGTSLTKDGTGALTLAGNHNYTGGTTVLGGTLQLGLGGATGAVTGNIVNSGTVAFNRSADLAYTGVISGSGELLKEGSGRVTMSAVQTFTGDTVVNGGTLALTGGSPGSGLHRLNSDTLIINSGATFSFNGIAQFGWAAGTPKVVMDGGRITTTNDSYQYLKDVTMRNGARIEFGNTTTGFNAVQNYSMAILVSQASAEPNVITGGAMALPITTGTVFNVARGTAAADLVIESLLRNHPTTNAAGVLAKEGTGILHLTRANTYTGGSFIRNGVLLFANGALGSAGTITHQAGVLRWDETNTEDLSARLLLVDGGSAGFDTNGNNVSFAAGIGSGASSSIDKLGPGTLTLAATSHSGETRVSGGTLALSQATLADTAAVRIASGATLHLTHGETDTVAALWINGVSQAAGTYNSANTGGAITGGGSLLVTGITGGFTAWINSFFPGETDPAIVGPDADANNDGVANALVYLFGGDPKDGDNLALLPTATTATNPGGTVPGGDYLVFTYRRDANASVTATVEHSTTLEAPWTAATHGQGGVVVVETPNGFASGIDRVEVFIPRAAARMFARVAATVP